MLAHLATALLYLAPLAPSTFTTPTLDSIINNPPTTFVTDHAGILDAKRELALNGKLARFERETTNQIIVYTLPEVPDDTTVEELATKAIETWKVGQQGKDNGIIVFVFPVDRVVRIEVGYGLEPVLPDLQARRITNEVMKPHFRANDYATGIEAGAEALMAAAAKEFAPAPRKVTPHPAPPGLIARMFSRGCGVAVYLLVAGIFLLIILLLLGVVAVMMRAVSRLKLGTPSSPSGTGVRKSEDERDDDDDYDERPPRGESRSPGSRPPSNFKGGGGSGGGGGATDRW